MYLFSSIGVGETITALVAIIGIFILPVVTVGYIVYYLLKTRNSQRMELLKQGIMPSSQMKAAPNKLTALRNGCIFIGLAAGIIAGLIVDYQIDYSDMGSFLIMIASSILFIGIGYIVYYLIVKNKNTDDE